MALSIVGKYVLRTTTRDIPVVVDIVLLHLKADLGYVSVNRDRLLGVSYRLICSSGKYELFGVVMLRSRSRSRFLIMNIQVGVQTGGAVLAAYVPNGATGSYLATISPRMCATWSLRQTRTAIGLLDRLQAAGALLLWLTAPDGSLEILYITENAAATLSNPEQSIALRCSRKTFFHVVRCKQ
jgi:hypothetical protein